MENDKKEKQSQRNQPETSQLDHDSSSLISPDLIEPTQALMNSLEELENLVKLIKSDNNKPLPIDFPDSDFPSRSTKVNPEK